MTISRGTLNGHTAKGALKPPPVQVWRARLHPHELEAAGFNAPGADQWEIIKGILRLKGIPEHYLVDGRPFKHSMDRKTGVLTLEFV